VSNLIYKAALAAMAGVASAAAVAQPPADKERAKVEFRRAETRPADGLKAATVAGTERKVYLHATAELTEKDVAAAAVGPGPSIDVTLTEAGAKKLEKLSGDHLDKPLAILVDGKVIAAPTIRAKLGGTVVITGDFTKAEAEKLAAAIAGK
jgi:preprotein translocase subunit SecD